MRKESRLLLFAAALLLVSCAGQVPPGGGPVDTTPPAIIFTEPDSNATNVQPQKIVLEFDEYVDRRSVEEAIFISPYVGQLEFEWSGREVTVLFDEPLRKSTTYVVNVGTDVTDIRARNRMENGFTLAFSTGEQIDQGIIKGRVFDDKPEGVMIFAYALGGINPDTLDPSRLKPDYIQQTGRDGSFTLSNIRFDSYRVFAVRDEYRNLIYDRQIDQYGVPGKDIRIDERSPYAIDLRFRLSVEDTARPFLTKVTPVSRTRLSVRFSEPLDSASYFSAAVLLEDTLSQKPFPVVLFSRDPSDSNVATVLTSAVLDSGRGYRMSVFAVKDLAGNTMDSANARVDFTGTGVPDTVRPKLEVVGFIDSLRDVALEQPIEIRFSKPVKQQPIEGAIALRDSALSIIPHKLNWSTASNAWLRPEMPLQSASWYSIRVLMDSVQDFLSNSYRDSVYNLRFRTLDLKTTGTLEGFVVEADSGAGLGDVVLSALMLGSYPPKEKTLRLPEPGAFKFEHLPEGRYTLQAYRDRDSSGTYSYGRPFPFSPPERFFIYPDTVKVRARWGVEGVNINFK